MNSKFITKDILEHLFEKGWVVIPNVVTRKECAKTVEKFWDWLESFGTPLDRNNEHTWMTKNIPASTHGIFQHFVIGHEQFVWDVRQNENVIKVFEELWGTEELLVSFDGANFSKPSARQNTWEHVDQRPHKKLNVPEGSIPKHLQKEWKDGLRCIQGFLNLRDSGMDDGGLVVYEKGHKLHAKFFQDTDRESSVKNDWYKFTDEDKQYFLDRGYKPKKICVNAGDMVLWDSRTPHYAVSPKKTTLSPHFPKRYRMVIYVCMMPKSFASKAEIQKKQKIFRERRMTTHWPCQTKLFPKFPRFYDKDMANKIDCNKYLFLTEKGVKMAGL